MTLLSGVSSRESPPLFIGDLTKITKLHPVDPQLADIFHQVRIESSVARAFSMDELLVLHDLIGRHHSLVEWTSIYDFVGMRLFGGAVFPGNLPTVPHEMTHSAFTHYAGELWHDPSVLRRIVLEFFPYLAKVVRGQTS